VRKLQFDKCHDSVSHVNITEAEFKTVQILVLDRVGPFFG